MKLDLEKLTHVPTYIANISFALGFLAREIRNPILGKIADGQFSDYIIQPGRYGGAFHSGSFFDVYNLRNPQGEESHVIGFGRHRDGEFSGDTTRFYYYTNEDYKTLLRYYAADADTRRIPIQYLAYGPDLDGIDTTVFIREKVDVAKKLVHIGEYDFIRYPELQDELAGFLAQTKRMKNESGQLPDIKNPSNVVLTNEGRMMLLDLNYCIPMVEGTNYGDRLPELPERIVLRNYYSMQRMMSEKISYRKAYDMECKIEWEHRTRPYRRRVR